MDSAIQANNILASLIYAGLGIAILVTSFIVIDKLTPQDLWKEISQNKNTALALLAGAFMLSVAIIIASAIH